MRSPAKLVATPKESPPGESSGGQVEPDAQDWCAPGSLSPTVIAPLPNGQASGDLPPGQVAAEAQVPLAGGDLDRGHIEGATREASAPVESSNGNGHVPCDAHVRPVVADNLNGSQSGHGDQQRIAADTSEGDGHACVGAQTKHADPSDALLLILADALDDLERTRIANENRLRSLRQVKGLEGSQAEDKLAALTTALADLEHHATLDLQRAMRKHPLGPWVKRTKGIGEKQGARLIAAIGDPAWNYAEDRPRRGPAELWAYCGFDPAQKRRKGVKSNWNATAKMRAHLCAEACMKQRTSPFRPVYDAERAKWADRDTSDMHKHNHALRVVAKAILKDLWREARRLQMPRDTRPSPGSPPAEEM